MPFPQHDAFIRMFTDRPQLAVEILRDLMEVDLPATPQIRMERSSFKSHLSVDIETDLVIVLGPPQAPEHAIIVEVPQDKSRDRRQLARCAVALWLQLGCAVSVLVVSADHEIAAHSARPTDSGLTGYRPQIRVLGPYSIPDNTDDSMFTPRCAASRRS